MFGRKYVDNKIRLILAKICTLFSRIKKVEIIKCDINDERLSNTREPKSHTHSTSSISGLQLLLDKKEESITKASGFNKNFGTNSNNVARGNHTHSAPESPLTDISTSNGTNNSICGLKQPYFGGDVPDGWETPIAIKTNLIHPISGKPIYLTGMTWSGVLGIPPE